MPKQIYIAHANTRITVTQYDNDGLHAKNRHATASNITAVTRFFLEGRIMRNDLGTGTIFQ